ncbi:NADPH-dependent FMN reductase [Streptomyces sp. NPDC006856]|uniref:NADPH-dependent FMN reductase n=1 Tax=unclassified Streptomyces TaxID=2593676 RepID=UPI003695F1DB
MSPTATPAPEYAHGTSGVLKNALEWMVGGGEIAAKPVALVSASTSTTGGDNARAWLAQTLTVMGAQVIPQDLRVSQATRKIEDGRLTDGPTVAALRDLLDDLADAAATGTRGGQPLRLTGRSPPVLSGCEPPRAFPDRVRRVTEAARRSGASLGQSGVSPGYALSNAAWNRAVTS